MKCGAKLDVDLWLTDTNRTLVSGATPVEPHGERRQITVVFADLVNSMGLSLALDAEDWTDIVREYQALCRRVIAENEGYLAQLLGDGVLVYFGYPRAHDDDPARAVRCGEGIIEGLAALRERARKTHGVEVNVRIGVHTGRVVVSELGEDEHERLAMGKVPNLAARIQGEAAPNTLAMSALSKRLVERWFDVEDIGARVLKGVDEPMRLYRPVTDRGVSAHVDDVRYQRSIEFVGREAELQQLRDRWTASRDGIRLTTVRGEAGIGKSRIIRELRAHVDTEEGQILGCFCSPYHRRSPLRAIMEMVERHLELANTADAERAAKLHTWAKSGPHNAESVPVLNDLLPALCPSIPYAPDNAQPSHRRQRTLNALADWLVHLAQNQPLLLCIEDVHWADPTTLDLIDVLLERGADAPICVVTTTRPVFTPPWADAEPLDLQPMDRANSERMLTQIAGKPLSGTLLTSVLQRAGGVPLFIEELMAWLLDSDYLVDTGATLQLAEKAKLGFQIPETLEAVLMTHLDRLGSAKMFAQVGAVLGRECQLDLLAAVASATAEATQLALDVLVESGTVLEKQRGGETLYVFKHALLQDAAYNSLLKSTRQQYHERTVDMLKADFPLVGANQPEVLALHLEEAGEHAEAFEFWKRAAILANERAAATEAVAFSQNALSNIHTLADPDAQKREELALQQLLGPALMATLGWASNEVAAASDRSRVLAMELEDYEALYGALWGLWTYNFLRGLTHQALEIAEQAVGMAKVSGEPLLQVTSEHAYGFTLYYMGEFERAVAHADRGLEPFQMELERVIASMFLFSSSGALYGYRTVSQWMMGQFESAEASEQAWFEMVNELDHLPSTAFAWSFVLYLHHARRDVDAVLATARKLLVVSQSEQFLLWIAVARIFCAWAECVSGAIDPQTAPRLLDEAIAAFRATETRIISIEVAGMTYEVRMMAGDEDGALQALNEGIADAATRGEEVFLPELHRLRGELAIKRAEPDAESHFEQAWSVASKQGAHALRLRTANDAFAQFKSAHWRDRVRDALAETQPLATEPDVQTATALLA